MTLGLSRVLDRLVDQLLNQAVLTPQEVGLVVVLQSLDQVKSQVVGEADGQVSLRTARVDPCTLRVHFNRLIMSSTPKVTFEREMGTHFSFLRQWPRFREIASTVSLCAASSLNSLQMRSASVRWCRETSYSP